MDIKIVEMGGRFGWAWSLWNEERAVAGGRTKTRERAEQAAYKASRMTGCCRCGGWKAGGGHRFCRECLLWQLDHRTPFEPGSRSIDVTHAPYYSNVHPPSPFIGHTNGKEDA